MTPDTNNPPAVQPGQPPEQAARVPWRTALARTLDRNKLLAYLERTGWVATEQVGCTVHTKVAEPGDHEDNWFEVVVPLRETRDKERRLLEVLTTLEVVENRPISDIVRDMMGEPKAEAQPSEPAPRPSRPVVPVDPDMLREAQINNGMWPGSPGVTSDNCNADVMPSAPHASAAALLKAHERTFDPEGKMPGLGGAHRAAVASMLRERAAAEAVAPLPCPFCAATPTVLSAGRPVVACANPDCPADPATSGHTREEAVAAWNRRAALPAPDGDVPLRVIDPVSPHAGYIPCERPRCIICGEGIPSGERDRGFNRCSHDAETRNRAQAAWNECGAREGKPGEQCCVIGCTRAAEFMVWHSVDRETYTCFAHRGTFAGQEFPYGSYDENRANIRGLSGILMVGRAPSAAPPAPAPAPVAADDDGDMLEAAWGLIANAWDRAGEQAGWADAAEKWRDRYHAYLVARCRQQQGGA